MSIINSPQGCCKDEVRSSLSSQHGVWHVVNLQQLPSSLSALLCTSPLLLCDFSSSPPCILPPFLLPPSHPSFSHSYYLFLEFGEHYSISSLFVFLLIFLALDKTMYQSGSQQEPDAMIISGKLRNRRNKGTIYKGLGRAWGNHKRHRKSLNLRKVGALHTPRCEGEGERIS